MVFFLLIKTFKNYILLLDGVPNRECVAFTPISRHKVPPRVEEGGIRLTNTLCTPNILEKFFEQLKCRVKASRWGALKKKLGPKMRW
jgi:hypothetical protein